MIDISIFYFTFTKKNINYLFIQKKIIFVFFSRNGYLARSWCCSFCLSICPWLLCFLNFSHKLKVKQRKINKNWNTKIKSEGGLICRKTRLMPILNVRWQKRRKIIVWMVLFSIISNSNKLGTTGLQMTKRPYFCSLFVGGEGTTSSAWRWNWGIRKGVLL